MPSLRPQPESDSEKTPHPTRSRSGTTNCRISNYIAERSRQYSRSPASDGSSEPGLGTSSPLLSPHDTRITHDSPQAEVVDHTSGALGAVGSVISFVDSGNDSDDSSSLNLHHDEIVDHLDVIDPQIGTVSSLANAANALLIPPNFWYCRRPVVEINYQPCPTSEGTLESRGGERPDKQLQDSLDRHVDDVLRNPSRFRRTMLGVWSFLKTPMGVLTAIYGFCVVFWGAAIIFFLCKFINFHNDNTQGFWVEVSSQVVNGLFTITGVGLIPFRTWDTYRIFWIWHYKRKTRRLRLKAGIPLLYDEDDLPDPTYDPNYVHVLTEKEEKFLHRQQIKFRYSQTWYRPHGTVTHRAFPINLALAICLLNDANSCFQVILCGTMWGLDRFQRPAWSTGILIPCGFLSGIAAALLIWRGGQKSKRVAEVEERLRAALIASDDVIPQQQTGYPPQLRYARRLTNVSEGLEEPEIRIDEHMTIPTQVVTEPSASDRTDSQ
ncbi:hypothetical protein J132_00498 [Termitomyces sp. J132]|nr:hypothetical protein J132_00498 [Termitomyces sp. J132]